MTKLDSMSRTHIVAKAALFLTSPDCGGPLSEGGELRGRLVFRRGDGGMSIFLHESKGTNAGSNGANDVVVASRDSVRKSHNESKKKKKRVVSDFMLVTWKQMERIFASSPVFR